VSETPQPAKKTQRPPKKIAIALPAINADESKDDERPVKRRKTGAGASSLLSMLPTPNQTNPTSASQRVLGGGAKESPFAFRTQSAAILLDTTEEDSRPAVSQRQTDDVPTATIFRPSSLAKGKKNVSVEEPGINHIAKRTTLPAPNVDFFSLGKDNTLCSLIMPYGLQEQLSPSPKHPSRNPFQHLPPFLLHRQPLRYLLLSHQNPHPQINILGTINYHQVHGLLTMQNTMRNL
jgi:hypothetical protein